MYVAVARFFQFVALNIGRRQMMMHLPSNDIEAIADAFVFVVVFAGLPIGVTHVVNKTICSSWFEACAFLDDRIFGALRPIEVLLQ